MLPSSAKVAPRMKFPPYHDGKLHSHLRDLDALAGDVFQLGAFDAEGAFAAETFAADFEQDAGVGAGGDSRFRGGLGHGGEL